MITERYKARECNICRKTLALKKGLFWNTVNDYLYLGVDHGTFGVDKVDICSECWRDLKFDLLRAIECGRRTKDGK